MKLIHMLVGEDYKPGDQAPDGYLAWHEWADMQAKAGLKQVECGRCGKWRFPQELSDQIDRCTMQSRKGPVVLETRVCIKCEEPHPTTEPASANPAGIEPASAKETM